ncbi:inositol monophosphatase family protein [Pelagibacterium halotolerans]|uniref:inositol monophosphatase family protein n=1 Tax=Pelagibacterium halotolerans TaxID=531813 RepID=UPI00384A59C6
MSIDVAALANILRDAAKAEILPRFRKLDAGEVTEKTDAVDLVTVADAAAERFIGKAVGVLAPGAAFVGEESVAADPSLLLEVGKADLAIVVDPIDGTANYAAGLPLFGVMASVVSKGETVAGIIYDPMGDDWLIAEKGAGAHLVRPTGEAIPISVSAPVALGDMVGHASLGLTPMDARKRFFANLAKPRIVANYRCAAHDYRTFATGHCHFLMFNKLMPWDHLAGALIVQEAGGYLAKFDGSPYAPSDTAGGLIVTPDAESWNVLRQAVFTV